MTKLLGMVRSHSISQIADAFGLTYPETKAILKEHKVKLRRGRKRGSGRGWELSAKARTDRRISRMTRMIEEGKCTSCGKPNDSDSLYHCKKCLKTRNEQAQERNRKKAEISEK